MGASKSGKPKTHKGLKKRVRVTGSGKVTRKQSFRGHLLSSRSSKRLRKLRRTVTLSPSDIKRTIEKLGLGTA
jgi:large subunit ribosomal protein L35